LEIHRFLSHYFLPRSQVELYYSCLEISTEYVE